MHRLTKDVPIAERIFTGLELDPLTIYIEAYGHMGGDSQAEICPGEETCYICADVQQNAYFSLAQPCSDMLLVPPFLYRRFFAITPSPLSYFAILTGYSAIINHMTGIFDPKYRGLRRTSTWFTAAARAREIAHALWVKYQSVYLAALDALLEAEPTHLALIALLERHVLYGMAVIEVVNGIEGDVDLDVDGEELYAKVVSLSNEKAAMQVSTAVQEWVDICPADNVQTILANIRVQNEQHANLMKILAASKKEDTTHASPSDERKKTAEETECEASGADMHDEQGDAQSTKGVQDDAQSTKDELSAANGVVSDA